MNITFDVPATEGMENYPLVVLQGHMDMVVAVKDGKEFDPPDKGYLQNAKRRGHQSSGGSRRP